MRYFLKSVQFCSPAVSNVERVCPEPVEGARLGPHLGFGTRDFDLAPPNRQSAIGNWQSKSASFRPLAPPWTRNQPPATAPQRKSASLRPLLSPPSLSGRIRRTTIRSWP